MDLRILLAAGALLALAALLSVALTRSPTDESGMPTEEFGFRSSGGWGAYADLSIGTDGSTILTLQSGEPSNAHTTSSVSVTAEERSALRALAAKVPETLPERVREPGTPPDPAPVPEGEQITIRIRGRYYHYAAAGFVPLAELKEMATLFKRILDRAR